MSVSLFQILSIFFALRIITISFFSNDNYDDNKNDNVDNNNHDNSNNNHNINIQYFFKSS